MAKYNLHNTILNKFFMKTINRKKHHKKLQLHDTIHLDPCKNTWFIGNAQTAENIVPAPEVNNCDKRQLKYPRSFVLLFHVCLAEASLGHLYRCGTLCLHASIMY